MPRLSFDWDPAKEQTNVRKHHVSFRQAAAIFRDPHQLTLYDEDHSDGEERWITLGIDGGGVLRVVVHTAEQIGSDLLRIRIISARKATRAETKQYQETNQ